MQIYGHSYDDVLEQFLASAPRYRLVAIPIRPVINEPKALNVGRELAAAINAMDRGSKTRFQFEVQDALMRIIHEHTFIDPVFGDCLIIDNPGILYEASLGVNVTNLLKSISKNTMTILLWPGETTPQKLFFLDRSSHYYIKQSDINYIII